MGSAPQSRRDHFSFARSQILPATHARDLDSYLLWTRHKGILRHVIQRQSTDEIWQVLRETYFHTVDSSSLVTPFQVSFNKKEDVVEVTTIGFILPIMAEVMVVLDVMEMAVVAEIQVVVVLRH
ncbi:hypothetical protein TorRG33x02_318770 [Trema orientale]|uniref:Uncharacterized protein n=1 Tax=Trema orientale TaxID=63057 RepID=A0A2P5BJY4_TREOI|nr:hypothetical protein TorRG33x02_318770 [Trema orientale]